MTGCCGKKDTQKDCTKGKKVVILLRLVTSPAAAGNRLTLAANTPHFPLPRWGNGEHDFDLVAAVTANHRPALVSCTGRDIGLGLSLLRHIASSFRFYFL
jgi:hypothetical protein